MILTAENYYSREANEKYLSVSQYKSFCGSLGKVPCEAEAMALLNGEWEEETSTSMMVGSYVDAHFEGALNMFTAQHSEVFKKDGTLKADYRKAEDIINRIERDEYFMKFMSGQKQVIMTGIIGGAEWKIKIDSYLPGICITDLKVMKSIRDTFWVRDVGYMDFVQYWGYDLQGAVYQEIVRQNMSVARAEKYIQELLDGQQKSPRRVNVGTFLNNLNQSLAKIQLSGISAVSERRETEDQIVLTITFPK